MHAHTPTSLQTDCVTKESPEEATDRGTGGTDARGPPKAVDAACIHRKANRLIGQAASVRDMG